MALVTWDTHEDIATVTLRRSDKLNSLNAEMIAELGHALTAAADVSRVVVLRAEPGVSVFSAGHDLADVPVGQADPHTWDNPVEELIAGVGHLPVPVIAAVEGTVWGAACNLVVACDLIVACDNVSFAITPAKLGVPYFGAGVSIMARSLPLHVVRAMFFTAEPLSAVDAHRFGMVTAVVPDEATLTTTVQRLATRISRLAPLTMQAVKSELAALDPHAPDTAAEREAFRRAAWLSADVQEGVSAFRERRHPEFRGQ